MQTDLFLQVFDLMLEAPIGSPEFLSFHFYLFRLWMGRETGSRKAKISFWGRVFSPRDAAAFMEFFFLILCITALG